MDRSPAPAYLEKAFDLPELWDPERYKGLEADRARFTITWIPNDTASILDLGCGNGVVTNLLVDQYPVVGIDLSHHALGWVRAPRCQGSAVALPFAQKSFDTLISTEVLEHLPHDSFLAALAEIARVTQRYLLITVPWNENLELEQSICPKCKARFNRNYHMRSFDRQTMQDLFKPWGFTLTKLEGIFPVGMPYFYRTWISFKRYILRRGMAFPWRGICPQCGYTTYQQGSTKPTTKPPIPKILQIMYPFVPKYPLPRWWIALYTRAS